MSASVLGLVSQKWALRQGFIASHLFIIYYFLPEKPGRREEEEQKKGMGKGRSQARV